MEDNYVLQGGISYDTTPNRNRLGRFAQQVFNMPTNARMLLRHLNPIDTKPSYVSEKDFKNNEIDAIKQAIYNKDYENKYANDLDIENRIRDNNNWTTKYNNEINNKPIYKLLNSIGLNKFVPTEKPIDINKYMRNSISYENYKPFEHELFNKKLAPQIGILDSLRLLNDPSYQAQTSIGSADYEILPNGNVILQDEYNFDKNKHMGGLNLLDLPHTIAAYLGNPYDTRMNLGNINDWDMKYTGNLLLGLEGEK